MASPPCVIRLTNLTDSLMESNLCAREGEP